MMLYLRFHLFNKITDFGHIVGRFFRRADGLGCCGCMFICCL
jgi:hypothetical protein